MTDQISEDFFQAAGAMMESGFQHLRKTEPEIFKAATELLRRGATISLISTIGLAGIGQVRCIAELGDESVVLFALQAQEKRMQ